MKKGSSTLRKTCWKTVFKIKNSKTMRKNKTATAIIAFANNKGGVGKTTTTAAIGTLLAREGYRTLLVDLDAQCSLTECFVKPAADRGGILSLMSSPLGALPDVIIRGEEFEHPETNLDLIPSSPDAGELESILTAKTSREMLLSRIFRNLQLEKTYDAVLLDCPPSLGLLTQNALVASNGLVVPTTAEYMPLMGLQKLQAKCAELADYFDPSIGIDGILITHYNGSKNLHGAVDEALRSHYGETVFQTRIRENVRLAECPQHRQSVFDYAPKSNGAADYEKFYEEFKKRFMI